MNWGIFVLKFLLIVMVAIVVIVAVLLVYASTRPDRFRIERSTLIDAPASQIYPHLMDFHAWRAWSPYEMRDPDMSRVYGGAEKGVGATYAWEGNSNVGSGSMEILEANEPSRLVIDLNFTAPMKARNTAIFTLTPEENGTRVTWAMEGEANLVAKTMQIFMDMDKMVGPDFETGLATLKSEVEER